MKKILFLFVVIFIIAFVIFFTITHYNNPQTTQNLNRYIALNEAYLELTSKNTNLHNQNLDSLCNEANTSIAHITKNTNSCIEIIEEAQALLQRANAGHYKLIDSQNLATHLDEYIIIATLPRGIYNLGLIPNSKHFEFTKTPSLQEEGKSWEYQWNIDSKGRSQQEFLTFLGNDKQAKIVFYDEGNDIFAPAGSAHTAILWAQQFGYKNLYRLVGGFGAWKALNMPISTQMPQCCEIQ